MISKFEMPLKLLIESYQVLGEPTEPFFQDEERFQLGRHLISYHATLGQDIVHLVHFALNGYQEDRGMGQVSLKIDKIEELYEIDRNIARFLQSMRQRCEPSSSQAVFIGFLEKLFDGAATPNLINVDCTLDAHLRIQLLKRYLTLILSSDFVPRFFDFDYWDDLDNIIASRYQCGVRHDFRRRTAFAVLGYLSGIEPAALHEDPALLKLALKEAVGSDPRFLRPRVEGIPTWPQDLLPNLDKVFTEVNAKQDYGKFLQLTTTYSLAQREGKGDYDSTRPLSFIRGYERSHHAMLRLLISLKQSGHLSVVSRVLVVGPRHRDEITFFRDYLGMPKAIGLDLFDDPGFVVGGDMHHIDARDGYFDLIYCCGTLSYSYNARVVVDEMVRVLSRPGHLILIDGAGRVGGPTPLARTDLNNVETLRRMFFKHNFETLLYDEGRSPDPRNYHCNPCLGLRIHADDYEAERLKW